MIAMISPASAFYFYIRSLMHWNVNLPICISLMYFVVNRGENSLSASPPTVTWWKEDLLWHRPDGKEYENWGKIREFSFKSLNNLFAPAPAQYNFRLSRAWYNGYDYEIYVILHKNLSHSPFSQYIITLIMQFCGAVIYKM